MPGLNKQLIIGNLGEDPELRHVNGDNAVCNLRVAANETWKDRDGQKQERVEWFRVNVWGAKAEACAKYLSKGSQVYIEGKTRTRKWEDKEGQTRYTTEVQASEVQFLGSKGERQGDRQESRGGGGSEPPPPDHGPDSDIPFVSCTLADHPHTPGGAAV